MKAAILAAVAVLATAVGPGMAAATGPPTPATVQAFQRHVRGVEAAVDLQIRGQRPFLWTDGSPTRLARVRRGEVVTEPAAGGSPVDVPDGLVHDWIGAAFIPGVSLDATLALVQDYNRHRTIYPEVVDSNVLSRTGGDFVVFMRLRKKKVLTVVLDTTHEARYVRLDDTRAYSRSRSTAITEVEEAGTPEERRLAPGDDHGFMWFLNTYWRFAARNGGVYVECEAVSLSRSIPLLLRWLIGPIVNDLPRESLTGTLEATRDALAHRPAGR